MSGPVLGGWTEDEEVEAEPELPDLIEAVVDGKYRVERVLGQGGMGTVYEAIQLGIERRVALKVINAAFVADKAFLKRFLREAIVISRLRHPNTVTLHDHGRLPDGRVFLVMERLEGRTLAGVIHKEGALPVARALEIGRQLCQALTEAHELGIVHRDLKPSNIFLTSVEGHRDWVKVLDFGIAKVAKTSGGTNLTGARLLGTPRYMSPEQIDGRCALDARADVYAIGLLLYEMLLGRPVFMEPIEASVLHKHLHEPPPPMKSVRPDLAIDPTLEAVVMRCLAKSPDDRPANARSLLDELAEIATIKAPALADQPTTSAMPDPAAGEETAFAETKSATPSAATLPETNASRRSARKLALAIFALSCAGLFYVVIGLPRTETPLVVVAARDQSPEPRSGVLDERATKKASKPQTWRVLEIRVVVGEVDAPTIAELRKRAQRAVHACDAGPPEAELIRLRLVRDRGKETATVRPLGSRAGAKLRECIGKARLLSAIESLTIVELEVGP